MGIIELSLVTVHARLSIENAIVLDRLSFVEAVENDRERKRGTIPCDNKFRDKVADL